MIFSGLKLKKNDFFFHNEMIYNFPELGKTKPVNSKTRFVTLKLQNIWSDFSSNIGYLLSKLEVMGREGAGNRQRRGLSLLLGSAFRGAYPVPTLYSEHPLSLLGLLSPPPTPTVSLLLLAPIHQAGWGRHCHGWEARGEDGENHSRAFLSSLGDERTQRTLTVSHRKIPSSVSLRARHSVTLNQVRMKIQDF